MNTSDISADKMNSDLIFTLKNIFDKCGFQYSLPKKEAQSSEYNAFVFKLNDLTIKFRTAKITPTKIGLFVTLWKRDKLGITQPHHILDSVDLFVISVRNKNHFGQFVFPKSILSERGIISNDKKEGKRGIRVYPPWDTTTNKQAQSTQKWQLDFFLEINEHRPLDIERIKALYGFKK